LELIHRKTAIRELMKMSILCLLTAVSVFWLILF
jgi:hypothetical protein